MVMKTTPWFFSIFLKSLKGDFQMPPMKSRKNKRGWIRIVEAFVAILLILGVVLIVVDEEYIEKKDISVKVYSTETAILREIQLNDVFRAYILDTSSSVEFDNFLPDLKNQINNRIPEYLNCTSKICVINNACDLSEPLEKNIYVQSVMIAANTNKYNPRQIKLFCWTEE